MRLELVAHRRRFQKESWSLGPRMLEKVRVAADMSVEPKFNIAGYQHGHRHELTI
ncbi:MAG: hypothetical protein JWM11_5874 [Planctomycetaceae bacterium]|nr:hypothetical protein [Planctomycetaceae bacterium]